MPQGTQGLPSAFPIENKPYTTMGQNYAFDDTGAQVVNFKVWCDKGRDASGLYSVQHRVALNTHHAGERQTFTYRNDKQVQLSTRDAFGRLLKEKDTSYDKKGGFLRKEEKVFASQGSARLVSSVVMDYAPMDKNKNQLPRSRTTTLYGEDGSKTVTREMYRNGEWHQVSSKGARIRPGAALEKVADVAQHLAHMPCEHQQGRDDIQRTA